MRCKKDHDHAIQPVRVAVHNLSQPWGIRRFHCPECPQVKKTGHVEDNWETMPIAQAQAQHRASCRDCFPAVSGKMASR